MRKMTLLTLLLISVSYAFAQVSDLKSVHLMKNKYGANCVQARNQIIQNEILQEGIIRARDLDLKDLVVISKLRNPRSLSSFF